jgi:prolyl oligopeptidase
MSRLTCTLLLASGFLLEAAGAAAQAPVYPATRQDTTADVYFGHRVPNPYRWLEELDGPATREWVEAENKVTFDYLGRLPQRDIIKRRLTALWNYPRVQIPVREAGQLFFRRNTGLQQQSVLYRMTSLVGTPRLVLDPNQLSPDGSIAVASWSASPDGRYVGYTTAAGGSDLQDIHLREVATGRDIAETVERIKFSGISWTRDGKGFYYARFKGSNEGANLQDANSFHQVWYHSLGSTPDRLIFDRPQNPDEFVGAGVSDDGRWLFASSGSGASSNRLWMADLGDPRHPNLAAPFTPIATADDALYTPLGVAGRTLYVYTTWQAPHGRIVGVPLGDSARAGWRDVVPENRDVISEYLLIGNRLVVAYLVDVQTRVRLFDLSGKAAGEVPLPDVGTGAGLTGKNDGDDFFFAFTSYLRPTTVYRYALKTGRLEPFQAAPTPFDPSGFETRATFYQSRDGTRIPIFVSARKGVAMDGSHPTLLYGYGGFNISLTPFFSPAVAAWLELGGVYAVANLRGGAEYGEAWHQAGMREKKQNVFDDFIAAAEFLVREGYTSPARLAVQGGSNGGLLVGAVMTQRPDLFGVALPEVGVMDMLRYQRFTGGKFWVDEYGSSDDSTAVANLLSYSPLHNLKPGTCYPATLVTTADHDDRVVPSHSFKFTATLQAAQGCARPTLIRVETSGSHTFSSTERIIAEIADQYAFTLANLGVLAP